MTGDLGKMRERLVLQSPAPVVRSLTSLTRASTVATAVTAVPHGYTTGDYVEHAGADQVAYNIKARVTVVSPTSYTFPVTGSPTTPATGTLTATFVSSAQGSPRLHYRTVDTVAAQQIPIGTAERLQFSAVQSVVRYRFRLRSRGDVRGSWRALWTPSWLAAAARKTLELTAPITDQRDPQFMFVDASEVN